MIYFIAKSSRSAGSSRQRAFIMAEFLQKAGVLAEVIPPLEYDAGENKRQVQWAYIKKLFSIGKNDTVILQNIIRNKRLIILMVMIRIVRRPKMIFDLDDGSYIRNPWIVKTLVAISDKVIVASHELARWPGLKKRPVLIMPNLVDWELAARFATEKNLQNDSSVLGWIGGAPDSLHNLKLLVPVFEKLIAEKVRFTFRLVGTAGDSDIEQTFKAIKGLTVEFVKELDWGKIGEIQKANASFDIGLCPLVDDEDNHVRCSLKVLDYMAAGIPVVISPIGENNYFLTNGVEGFLPKNTEEWVATLQKLIGNKDVRQNMGEKAREKLKREYSYQMKTPAYADFISG